MSSRPVSNLAKILASVTMKEDEVVVTPEPTAAPAEGILGPEVMVKLEEALKRRVLLDNDTFANTPGAWSRQSSEDVPLTAELLSPEVSSRVPTENYTFGVAAETEEKDTSTTSSCSQRDDRKKRFLKKRAKSPLKKNELPADANTEQAGTSDGADAYQEKPEGRVVRRLRRKVKQREESN